MNSALTPTPGMVRLTHLIYGLHAFAVVSALLGSATIILSFIASLPSIVAVVLNYWNRGAVRGTWLESHFRWQIRTFWWTLGWVLIATLLVITIIGIPFALLAVLVVSAWVVYRVARGWWRLADELPMPLPTDGQ
ncbi:DUF4870 family protein [Pseudothauera lacus]|uniref:Transmembrane protein n=1 Tax=Pseudothauera lacus TaxID=2136175 RepID=A0A2T4IK14_9RHOO|nr:hypothetical protein [Pseudothauera lacus]PTD98105.1 hypothetical protein C8261_01420 [Pseudothauera lacus]